MKIYLNDAEANSTTTKSDAEGRFVFDGLSTEPGYSYEVMLTFQEAEYYGERLSFNEGETTKSVEVTVYDATTSDEAIRVATAHTIIYIEQGSLWVKEYFFFVNESDRTYIGPTAGGNGVTLRFSLPKEATELQYGLELMECCIVGSEEGFDDTMPVLPGSKEVVYAYRVSYNSRAYTFPQRVNYPIASFDLMVQGEGTEVVNEQLTTGELLNIEDTWFNHLSGSDFAPGDILTTRLSSLPSTTDNQGAIVWVALALVVLAGGFGFSYLLRKKRLQPVTPEGRLDQKRQRLLVELAKLDDDLEDGKIPEDVYRRLRAERKTQLVKLMQGAKEKSGKG